MDRFEGPDELFRESIVKSQNREVVEFPTLEGFKSRVDVVLRDTALR